MSDSHFDRYFPMPDPDDFETPARPAEMFPWEFQTQIAHGYAKAALIGEMLAMGHLVEAGRLIVGDTEFPVEAETIGLPRRTLPENE
jgi:hypothetical protein